MSPDEQDRRDNRAKLEDADLERAVLLAAVNAYTDAGSLAAEMLTVESFTAQDCQEVWRILEPLLIEREGFVHQTLLIERLGWQPSDWERFRDRTPVRLVGPVETDRAIEAVATAAARRQLIRLGMFLAGSARDVRNDPDEIAKTYGEQVAQVRAYVAEAPPARSLADILATDYGENAYDWIVPGLLEALDRVIITGGEGRGKMTLLRQLAIQFSVGFHPWTAERFDPLRCLLIDLQDGQRRNEREIFRICQRAGVEPGPAFWTHSWTTGLDVISRVADRKAVEGLVKTHKPDVVVIGPVYRLAKDQAREKSETAQQMLDFFDRLRARYGIALLLEAHMPQGSAATGQRTMRPYGGQEFAAWPDAGYGIAADGALKDWRGNRDRGQKEWPHRIVHGAVWPWVPPGHSFGPLRADGKTGRLLGAQAEADADSFERSLEEQAERDEQASLGDEFEAHAPKRKPRKRKDPA